MHIFSHRAHAGRVLAESFRHRLEQRRGVDATPKPLPEKPDLVLALPRGGVPVAFEIASAFDAPLEVWVARKIGVPGRPELGMGAIAEGGGRYVNQAILRTLLIDARAFASVEEKERMELQRRVHKYRGGQDVPKVEDQFVWLIDDGIATGATILAATQGVLAQQPRALWLGVPVALQSSLDVLPHAIDEIICAHVPKDLWSVGAFYDDFRQVSDEEVIEYLKQAKTWSPTARRSYPPRQDAPRAP